MVVCLHAKTNMTLSDHHVPIYSRTRATFDQNHSYRNHPESLGSKFITAPYRWIVLNISLSNGYLLSQGLSVKSSSLLSQVYWKQNRTERKDTFHPKKKVKGI